MKILRELIALVVIGFMAYVILPTRAHAYLDPGTGSYIIQILIATLAGGTYVVFASWGKIKTFFRGLISKFSKDRKDAPRR